MLGVHPVCACGNQAVSRCRHCTHPICVQHLVGRSPTQVCTTCAARIVANHYRPYDREEQVRLCNYCGGALHRERSYWRCEVCLALFIRERQRA